MGYKTEELVELSLKAIEKYKPLYIEELVTYLPCSLRTFYEHRLHESQVIKDAMYKEIVSLKTGLRQKWYKGNSHVAQIALYKLMANEAELKALNGEYRTEVNVTNNGPIKTIYELDEEE